MEERTNAWKMARSPLRGSGKWTLALEALCLVASHATPIDAMPGVYFLVYPRGTRKAEQATAGRLWPRKSLGGWTRKALEAGASKPTQRRL